MTSYHPIQKYQWVTFGYSVKFQPTLHIFFCYYTLTQHIVNLLLIETNHRIGGLSDHFDDLSQQLGQFILLFGHTEQNSCIEPLLIQLR